MTPFRVLAIDYGTKRIGLALSDPTGTIASGLMTIDASTFYARIATLVGDHDVRLIVLGNPLTLRGEVGDRATSVAKFAARLRAVVAMPVELWDERFTSSMAERSRIEAGVKRQDRRDKRRVDEMAAVILLQSFLDSRRFREIRTTADAGV